MQVSLKVKSKQEDEEPLESFEEVEELVEEISEEEISAAPQETDIQIIATEEVCAQFIACM